MSPAIVCTLRAPSAQPPGQVTVGSSTSAGGGGASGSGGEGGAPGTTLRRLVSAPFAGTVQFALRAAK